MILIIAQNGDVSAIKVIDWLIYSDKEVIVINEKDTIILMQIELNKLKTDVQLKLKKLNKEINFNQIKSYWYRRGEIKYNFQYSDYKNEIQNHLYEELEGVLDFFHYILEKKKHIGSFSKRNINKIVCLSIAKDVGFLIPNTTITNSKKRAIKFFNEETEAITKGIANLINFTDVVNKRKYVSFTSELNKDKVEDWGNYFFPSKIQKKINKLFEVRIFSINDSFWGMAIFSQNNSKTALDFRHYDNELPNRNIPFNIPTEIIQKLKVFMEITSINTGSFDFIITTDYEFVFLEVNPDGQFDFVSYQCNYYLEKEISEYLSNE